MTETSRTLVVMRHAKSSWKTNEPDVRRPLSARGTRDAVVAGQSLARIGIDAVLCSSAVRAQQTWQCLRMGGTTCGDVRVVERLYGASGDDVLAELRALPAETESVLLINHEPTVSDVVLRLAAPSSLTDAVADRFPTAGIAVLSFTGGWASLADGRAHLVSFQAPRG